MLEVMLFSVSLSFSVPLCLGEESRFFERYQVDFWGTKRKAAVPEADLWADANAPPPVRRLLESPSGENARAYLSWQEERFRRLRAAIVAVEKAQASILYFARPGCRWCALQEEELRGLVVVRVPPDSPLWKEHGVSVTPTLIASGRVFRGFTPRAALVEAMGRD